MALQLLHDTLQVCQRSADARLATLAAWHRIAPHLRGRTQVLATGKASVAMLDAALQHLHADMLGDILISCPPEHEARGLAITRHLQGTVKVRPCDHPLPTPRNIAAAQDTLTFAQSRATHDTLLVLLSGGASAHLCLPAPTVTLNELASCTRALQRSGATIRELNTVRKHVERLKGGGLARASATSTVVTAILSDVLPGPDGEPALDTIASGPTVPDVTTFADAINVLRSRHVHDAPGIMAHLERGARGELPETPKSRGDLGADTHEIIVGDNGMILEAASHFLQSQGVNVVAMRPRVEGEAARIARQMLHDMRSVPACSDSLRAIIVGGEWTVAATGSTGVGGPSQELALAALLAMQPDETCHLLAYSSDGLDGPTDAAGALVSSAMLHGAPRAALEAALTNHDAHLALDSIGALIRTGPTGTNVNHIAILLW